MPIFSLIVRIIGTAICLAGISMAAYGFYILTHIPICAPPPPAGLIVPGCELRGFAYIIAPLGVMIALIGLGIFAVAQSSHFFHRKNGLTEGKTDGLAEAP